MKFKPLDKRYLVEVQEAKTASGLIISVDTEDMKQNTGVIVATPIKIDDSKPILKLGDKIQFENVAVDVTVEGKDYKLVHEAYIQGILL